MSRFLDEFELAYLFPLLLAVLLGVLFGWLLWRWRRSPVDAGEYSQLVTAATNYKTEVGVLRSSKMAVDTELQTQRSSFSLLEKQTATMRDEFETLNATIFSLQSAHDVAIAERSKAADELKVATDAQAQLVAELEATNADRTTMYTNLQAFAEDRTRLLAEIEAAAAERARLTHALESAGLEQPFDANAVQPAALDLSGLQGDGDQTHVTGELSDLTAQLFAATAAQNSLENELHEAMAENLQLVADLEEANADRAELRADLDSANLGIVSVREDLLAAMASQEEAATQARDAIQAQLAASQAQVNSLRAQREADGHVVGDHDAGVGLAADYEADLAAARALAVSLKAELAAAERSAAEASKAKAELAKRAGRIKELEGQLAAAPPASSNSLESLAIGSWKRGLTSLGTPGADHADDLKQINGIGPKMEDVLNSFGIISWEQLAALTESEVATVDGALTDFPGRIERDQWVEQAQAFIVNGHAPLAKDRTAEYKAELAKRAGRIKELEGQLAAAPAASSNSLEALAAGSWQRGVTTLGTPGADHADDLKQINGIGPKMEDVLNSFGIISWEQLAALTESEVAIVDGALTDFPGRIERDQWVAQAEAFIVNGHAPVARAPRTRTDKSGRITIADWAQGETPLGIAGAVHTDDLKVINGIGPKMEAVLKTFGITSWEQVASFKKADCDKVTEALDTFPGRIERDEWVAQAKDLVKRFPLTSPYHRPTRDTYLNNSTNG